jgi:hypothetical protein
VDLVTGVATQAGTVPEQSGWYKDLAWDSANNRILAMHFGPGVDIGVLDPFAHTFTSLGIVSGLSPAGHFTGLAVGPHGEMAISDDALGHVWDVISSNGALMGVQRSAMVNPSTLHGLEFDPDTGDLLTSDTINIVRADGSLQMLRSDVLGDDLAFMPVPGPAAGLALITIGAGYGAVRRPRGG